MSRRLPSPPRRMPPSAGYISPGPDSVFVGQAPTFTSAHSAAPTRPGVLQLPARAPQTPAIQGLEELSPDSLFQRRTHHRSDEKTRTAAMDGAICHRCNEGFGPDEQIVSSGKETWHEHCFVCAQCFQPFPDGVFFEFEGRKYCERDFQILYAPCCAKCNGFVVGRVIKALNSNWHPNCFLCQLCSKPLAEEGFVKNAGRALCRDCNHREKAAGAGKCICHKCHGIIDEGVLRHKGEMFHPYHFSCNSCGIELTAEAREVKGDLYCLRCHDKMGIPICGACRRPVEERVVYALGKAWHVEHFVCGKCEKPFLGSKHWEKRGVAYCELHYHQLFGNMCFSCDQVIPGVVFSALLKSWCIEHFCCSVCERPMNQKTKFYEVDMKPVCKHCYERFPNDMKRRLKLYYDLVQNRKINPQTQKQNQKS